MQEDDKFKLSVDIRPKHYQDEDVLVGVIGRNEDQLIILEDYFKVRLNLSMSVVKLRAKLKGFELLPRVSRDYKIICLIYNLGEPSFYLWICRLEGFCLQELKKIDIGSAEIVWMRALKCVNLQTIVEKPHECLKLQAMNKTEREYLPSTVLYVTRPDYVKIVFFRDFKDIDSLLVTDLGGEHRRVESVGSIPVDAPYSSRLDLVADPLIFYDRDSIENFGKNYSEQTPLSKKLATPKGYKSAPLFDATLGITIFVTRESSSSDLRNPSDEGPYCVVISDSLGLHSLMKILLPQEQLDSISPNRSYLSGFFKSAPINKAKIEKSGQLPNSCQHVCFSSSGHLLSLFDFEGRNFHLYRLVENKVEFLGVYTRGNTDGLIKEVQINSEGGYVVVGTHNHETIHVFQIKSGLAEEEVKRPSQGSKMDAPHTFEEPMKKAWFGLNIPSWTGITNAVSAIYSAGHKSNAKFKRKLDQEIEVFSLGSGMIMLSVDGEWMKITDKDEMQREFSRPIEHLDIKWSSNIFREIPIQDVRFVDTL
jgi:hypothetical protein